MMSFSLAPAGSVMVTVSFISVLPECLMDNYNDGSSQESVAGDATGGGVTSSTTITTSEQTFKMIPFSFMSWMMFYSPFL